VTLPGYYFPSSGAELELSRLKFYFERAAKTRTPEVADVWNGRSEELTTLCGLAFGDLCVGSNPTPNQCFELVNGKVRLLDTTFEVLMSKIDGTRSPGSPYSNAGYPTNADIPIGMLRAAVEERLTLCTSLLIRISAI